jgi:intein-encoded DNA endonuclease-like protein
MKTIDKNIVQFMDIKNLNIDEVVVQYEKLKSIRKTAKYFNVPHTKLRRLFIKNNIEYKKATRYICDDAFFSRDNEASFYWAGFMAADGNVSKKDDINIDLKGSDDGHLMKFQAAVKTDSPIRYKTTKEKTINIRGKVHIIKSSKLCLITFRSHEMARDLKRFNIVPNKTKTYDIPNWIISHPLFNHFIRGYFDGDGCFAMGKRELTIWSICGNFSTMDKIKSNLEVNCDITGNPQFVPHNNIHILTYYKQQDITNIINYLYKNATIWLDRKYELSLKVRKIVPRKVSIPKQVLIDLIKETPLVIGTKLETISGYAKKLGCSVRIIKKRLREHGLN